jgi:peptidyl-prolyl cis-trans isomerase D
MAIIGKIRKHYWMLIVVIGVAMLLFVLTMFDKKANGYGGQQSKIVVGVVAGEKISLNEFNIKVEENIELQKANSGKDNITSDESFQIRQGTWQQMMNEIVMNKQYDKLGISVTVDELDDMIRGKNPHQYIVQSFTDPKTGQFDAKAVNNFLQNLDNVDPKMKQRYLAMEKAIKADRLTTKYNNLIIKGYYLPTAFAKRSYDEANKMAKVRLAGVRYQAISDSAVKLTDADYEKYYNENKYKFNQDKPVRDIEFVVFEPKASEEDMAKIKADINSLYAEFQTVTDVPTFVNSSSDNRYDSTWKKRGSFSPAIDSALFKAAVGTIFPPFDDNGVLRLFKIMDKQARPDSLRASHILISYAGAQVPDIKRSKDAAIKQADSILAVVKKTPASFEMIAATMSDDATAKAKSGDLDWFVDGTMVPAFNSAVLNGNIGDIVKVETPFGYHIIKITGKKEPILKLKVASVDRRIEPSSKTIESVYNEASMFASVNNTLEKLEKAVKDKGLELRNGERTDAMADKLPGVDHAREVVRWAFQEETEKGAVSNVFDTDGKYVVAAVKTVVEKGTIPLEIMKEPIKSLVMREKKAEMLIKKINNQFAKLKDINTLISEYNIKIDTSEISFASANIPNYGHEAKVTGMIFGMKKGQMSAPIQGEQAVYVVIFDEMKEAPVTKDFENQKRQMAMNFQSRTNQLSTILQEAAAIKDNRALIY